MIIFQKLLVLKLSKKQSHAPFPPLREQKENMAFLYDGDKCIGTDTQIIPKNNPDNQYNVLTIPNAGIRNKVYDPNKDQKPYDTSLLKKFMQNF